MREQGPRPDRRGGGALPGGDALSGRRSRAAAVDPRVDGDSAALVYSKYVADLDGAELDALWADYRVVGRLFGLRDRDGAAGRLARVPRLHLAMRASGDLVVTERARRLAIDVVLNPPAPLVARPLVALVNQITVGLLPRDLRRQYGLHWDPIRHVALEGGAVLRSGCSSLARDGCA